MVLIFAASIVLDAAIIVTLLAIFYYKRYSEWNPKGFLGVFWNIGRFWDETILFSARCVYSFFRYCFWTGPIKVYRSILAMIGYMKPQKAADSLEHNQTSTGCCSLTLPSLFVAKTLTQLKQAKTENNLSCAVPKQTKRSEEAGGENLRTLKIREIGQNLNGELSGAYESKDQKVADAMSGGGLGEVRISGLPPALLAASALRDVKGITQALRAAVQRDQEQVGLEGNRQEERSCGGLRESRISSHLSVATTASAARDAKFVSRAPYPHHLQKSITLSMTKTAMITTHSVPYSPSSIPSTRHSPHAMKSSLDQTDEIINKLGLPLISILEETHMLTSQSTPSSCASASAELNQAISVPILEIPCNDHFRSPIQRPTISTELKTTVPLDDLECARSDASDIIDEFLAQLSALDHSI